MKDDHALLITFIQNWILTFQSVDHGPGMEGMDYSLDVDDRIAKEHRLRFFGHLLNQTCLWLWLIYAYAYSLIGRGGNMDSSRLSVQLSTDPCSHIVRYFQHKDSGGLKFRRGILAFDPVLGKQCATL